MLLLTILDYYKLFHLKLFLSIINYFTLDNFLAILNNFNTWQLVVLLLRLLVPILLVVINVYQWLLY
jgi:hypothetical protein